MEENWDSVHEQNVTRGLQLSDRAQVWWMVVGVIFMATGISYASFLASDAFSFEFAFTVVGALLIALSVFVTIAIKATSELLTFKKISRKSYDDGQEFMKRQPFSSTFVFNLNSPIIKRLYGKW